MFEEIVDSFPGSASMVEESTPVNSDELPLGEVDDGSLSPAPSSASMPAGVDDSPSVSESDGGSESDADDAGSYSVSDDVLVELSNVREEISLLSSEVNDIYALLVERSESDSRSSLSTKSLSDLPVVELFLVFIFVILLFQTVISFARGILT